MRHLAFDLFLIANEHIVIDTIVIVFKMKGISIQTANTIHFTMKYSKKRERETQTNRKHQQQSTKRRTTTTTKKQKETIQFEWAAIKIRNANISG